MSSGDEIGEERQYFKCMAVKWVQVYMSVFKPESLCISSCGALSPMSNTSQ